MFEQLSERLVSLLGATAVLKPRHGKMNNYIGAIHANMISRLLQDYDCRHRARLRRVLQCQDRGLRHKQRKST